MEPCALEATLHGVVDTCESYVPLAAFGLRVEQTQDRGRRVVSTAFHRRGDVVLRVDPLIVSVHEPHKKDVCQGCLAWTEAEKHPVSCVSCRQVYYCSENCRLTDASHTTMACHAYRQIPSVQKSNPLLKEYPMLTSYLRMLIDLLAQRQRSSTEQIWGSEPELQLLQSCRYRNDAETIEDFYMLSKLVIQMLPKEYRAHVHVAYLMDFLCRERCNSFAQVDSRGQMLAWGVYVMSSFINHSCYPNAVKRFKGKTLELVAVRDIKPGQELNISYLRLDDNVEDRQEVSLDIFLFKCDCMRCIFEKEKGSEAAKDLFGDIVNNVCSCGGVFVDSVCVKCGCCTEPSIPSAPSISQATPEP